MKLTENTKVRIKVPKHLYEAIQAQLDQKHEMEEDEEYMKEDSIEEIDEADGQQASVEEIAVAMDKAVVQAKKRAQEIADKKGGKLTQSDFFSVIDKFRSKIKEFGPFKRVTETEEMDETLDLKSLMEAVSAATKKKAAIKKKKIEDKKIADKKTKLTKEKEDKIAADKKVKETKEKAEAAAAKKKVEAAKKK
jgi:hypothetical protein